MDRWSLTRLTGVCFAALLLCSTAKAASLSEFDPLWSDGIPIWTGGLARGAWSPASELPGATGGVRDVSVPLWSVDSPLSGTTGGAERPSSSDWSLERGPDGTSGGIQHLPSFVMPSMLGGPPDRLLLSALDNSADPDPVPLPAALWLFGSGAAALTLLLRRRAARKGAIDQSSAP